MDATRNSPDPDDRSDGITAYDDWESPVTYRGDERRKRFDPTADDSDLSPETRTDLDRDPGDGMMAADDWEAPVQYRGDERRKRFDPTADDSDLSPETRTDLDRDPGERIDGQDLVGVPADADRFDASFVDDKNGWDVPNDWDPRDLFTAPADDGLDG